MPKAALMWPPVKDCMPGQKRRPKMGEDTPKGRCLKDYVLDLAPVYRVRCYHTHLAIQSTLKGFPDIVALGSDILYRELKGDGKEPTDDQYEILDLIQAAGGNAGWWNPDDWYSGRIKQELAAISPRAARTPAPAARLLVPAGSAIRLQDVHADLNRLVEAARTAIGAGPTSGGVRIELDSLKTVLSGYVDELVERAVTEVGHRRTGNPAHGGPR